MRSHASKPLSSVAVVASDKPKNMKTKSPTLLEIACRFNHWSEYLDVDGHIDEHEFAVTDPVGRLIQIQECGYSETYRADLYQPSGDLWAENVLVEIESAGCDDGELPSVRINGGQYRTRDLKITSDTITTIGGWYVVVRSTEGGAE